MRKPNSFNKIVLFMKDGQMKTIDEFKEHFKDDERMSKTMYRLSAYMWSLKNKLGAVIKAHKNGKNIVGYQLMNPKDYDDLGKKLPKKVQVYEKK